MSDSSSLLPLPPGHLLGSSRQYRSTSGSPTRQRHADDFLAQFSPTSALEALRNPSGPLKRCLDSATPSEQSFAMRAALASQNIQDWLDELSSWSWPTETPSAGFETPGVRNNESTGTPQLGSMNTASTQHLQETRVGSLTAAEFAKYDKRIDAIQGDMDDLELEEIKSHVLHHHIFPLSRPGTPLFETDRIGASSMYNFNTMNDLTAIVTAVVVQTLPKLSKLIRLMNTWNIRLLVLKRVTAMMTALTDAEVAIRAGWDAIHVGAEHGLESQESTNSGSGSSTLTGEDFQIMKQVVERKIAKAAQIMDFMLDSLDGRAETIPDEWIDRMDDVENEYSRWVAVCERKIREAGWNASSREKQTPTTKTGAVEPASPLLEPETNSEPLTNSLGPEEPPTQEPEVNTQILRNDSAAEAIADEKHSRNGERFEVKSSTWLDFPHIPRPLLQRPEGFLDTGDQSRAAKTEMAQSGYDGPIDRELKNGPTSAEVSTAVSPSMSEETVLNNEAERKNAPGHLTPESQPSEKGENRYGTEPHPFLTQQNRVSELPRELTPRTSSESLRSERSEPSLPTFNGVQSQDQGVPEVRNDTQALTSDVHEGFNEPQATPELPRMQYVDAEPSLNGDSSPPSSPPNFRASTRSTVTFNDMPTVAEIPDDESAPDTPLDSSFLHDTDISRTVARPSRRLSVSSEDDQLQQQISEILESIPAKIHLSSQPSPNHLNPPDFQLPRAKPKQTEPGRSHSSLSSRAGTPSFLLAPAYNRNPRPRQQRGNQEIKLYHLSRSTGEAPIKLFIRLVGENGERVMVRVGGGWADLGEYLKEYASHHGRRSKNGGGESKIEIRDLPPLSTGKNIGSSPPSRPASALDSPMTPLNVRKTRRSIGDEPAKTPRTPLASVAKSDTPSSGTSTRSRSSSRLSWTEEDSSLGMSGPKTKNVEMTEESRAWVESVKEKVRLASGERKPSDGTTEGKFGEIGKVGGTKRLFRKG